MPRALRHEYPGAVYPLIARGDGGKMILESDADRKDFLCWLEIGHPGSMSRLVSASGRDPKGRRKLRKLEELLKCAS